MKTQSFIADLGNTGKIAFDSAIPIYHLEDIRPFSDLTEIAFAELAVGRREGLLSTVSVCELLVKPFSRGLAGRVAELERIILGFPGLSIIDVDLAIAREAARLRAKYGLRAPNALIGATALDRKAKVLVTNDRRLLRLKKEGIGVLVLGDYT